MKIANFADAHHVLSQFYGVSKHYSLENIRAFLDTLGNPQDNLHVIHVAGTSGKTSTCYYIAGLLKASGKTVGLTVSPHVDEINERVQINLEPLPETIFCQHLEEFLKLVGASKIPLSYFEIMVAFAYWYFAKVGVDYAVIEVGLGGRLDGTNVINRQDKVCVITNIGLDHTHILGDTLPKIAAEKAGIITQNNAVFTHDQAAEVIEVIAQAAQQQQTFLRVYKPQVNPLARELSLFQQHNFGLAVEAVRYVLERENIELTSTMMVQATKTYVPARMEAVRYKNRTLIIDGAHNGQKMETLLESINAKYPGKSIAALVAFVDGDQSRSKEAIGVLVPRVKSIIVTEFASDQDMPKKSIPAQSVAEVVNAHGFHNLSICTDPVTALQRLVEQPEELLLVTGSFYLLNHIRPLIIQS